MKVGDDRDIECGKHSGIPECCIEWYIGPWSNIVARVPVLWKAYWDHNQTESTYYIRCPECIENKNIVKVKECDCESR